MSELQNFHAIEQISITDLQGAQWQAYYADLVPWLTHAEVDIRKRAVNRLYTAVFSVEPRSKPVRPERSGLSDQDTLARIDWFFAAIESSHAVHHDVIALALKHFCFASAYSPADPLPQWLARLHANPPPGVDGGMIEGILLLGQPFDEDDPEAVARMVALLDHPSNYVRACAAVNMSAMRGPALDAVKMFALIKDKEIVRPGIAGPYWSEWWACDDVPIDPIDWMMDILERRSGPEPEDMPFTGIDFYLHEICGNSPTTVQRMIDGGYFHLATETATETLGVVAGMAHVLQRLADNPDAEIRRRTQFHLAHFYRILHPEAAKHGAIQRRPDWSKQADVFSFHHGSERALWFITLYPLDAGGELTDSAAWDLIDHAMPPALRGGVDRHPLQFNKAALPGPHTVASNSSWRFAAGVTIDLHGDPAAKIWTRIDISAAKLGQSWQPFAARV